MDADTEENRKASDDQIGKYDYPIPYHVDTLFDWIGYCHSISQHLGELDYLHFMRVQDAMQKKEPLRCWYSIADEAIIYVNKVVKERTENEQANTLKQERGSHDPQDQ